MPVTIRGSGQIIVQIVQTAYTTVDSTTSTSMVNTGCTATITPTSSSNRVLAMLSMPTYHNASTGDVGTRIMRGSSAAFSGISSDFWNSSGTGVTGNANLQWIDSPATTSPVTYTVQFLSWNSSTVSINRDFNSNNTGVTYLTLMEISG